MQGDESEIHSVAIWNNASLIGGGLTLVIGAFVLEESSGYGRGSPLRMGPGFFPTLLGVLLLLLGGLLIISSLRGAVWRIKQVEFRALACILGSLALFGLVLPRYGLAPAILSQILTSACASPSSRPLPTIFLALAVTVFAWLIFVRMLSIPLPMFSW